MYKMDINYFLCYERAEQVAVQANCHFHRSFEQVTNQKTRFA